MVHHVQAAAAALRVQVVVGLHAQVAVDRLVQAAAVPHAQVAMVPHVLQVPVAQAPVPHVREAADLLATEAVPAVVVIVADRAVGPVAVLRSVVLSQRLWTMIFNKRKKPSSWKV